MKHNKSATDWASLHSSRETSTFEVLSGNNRASKLFSDQVKDIGSEQVAAGTPIDLVVAIATTKERDAVMESFRLDNPRDLSFHGVLKRGMLRSAIGKEISVGIAHVPNVGIAHTACYITMLATLLRPRMVAMAGVCMGHPESVSIGDVIVAEYVSNHDAVKRRVSTIEHRSDSFPTTPEVRHAVSRVQATREAWMDAELGTTPKERPEIVLSPMTSGSSLVVDNGLTISTARRARAQVSGLDMESYAVACACSYTSVRHWIVVKSVLDYGIDPSNPRALAFDPQLSESAKRKLCPKDDSNYERCAKYATIVSRRICYEFVW